jgi:hypothetical protein
MDFILVNFRYRESAWRMAVEILYVVQRNKRLQRTAWRCCNGVEAGHAQKKSNDDSKGLVYLCCKENYSIFFVVFVFFSMASL